MGLKQHYSNAHKYYKQVTKFMSVQILIAILTNNFLYTFIDFYGIFWDNNDVLTVISSSETVIKVGTATRKTVCVE